MKEKILTQKIVRETGLDKVSVITADMLDGYSSIGEYAFLNCTGLTSIVIHNSVTSIGDDVFHGCTSLTSVTIGNSVTSIGKGAFAYCDGLTSIEIPTSVTSIGNNAFFGCHGLTSVVWNAKNCSSSGNFGSQVSSFTFGDDVEIIPPSFCAGMFNLTSIIIPNSVTSIGDFAFYRCSGLTGELIIPNSVTSIGKFAFCECGGLTSITIPNSVISIGDWAFEDCTGLTSLTIANSVTSIGNAAFFSSNNLISVTIANKEYKTQEVKDGKCKGYKAFNSDMTCRDFQYEEGKTYEFNGEPKLCEQGFHACLSLADVFRYYNGEIGKDIVVYEVELEGVSDEKQYDSKVVAKKITIGKRIL